MSLAELIPGLGKLLDYFASERHRRDDKFDAALAAIYAAATETKILLADTEQAGSRDREREREVARLWSAAAIPVRRFDPDLADRCLLKFEFWANPLKWKADDATEKRIAVDGILERARTLLLNP
jgi:hypothetical protein